MRRSHVLIICGLAGALPLQGAGAAPPPPPAGSEGELSPSGREALAAVVAVPARGKKCLHRVRAALYADDFRSVHTYAELLPKAEDRAQFAALMKHVEGGVPEDSIPPSDDAIFRGFGYEIVEARDNKGALRHCDFIARIRAAATGSEKAVTILSYTSRDMRGRVDVIPLILSRTARGWRLHYVAEGYSMTVH